jgi:hypothetical protein
MLKHVGLLHLRKVMRAQPAATCVCLLVWQVGCARQSPPVNTQSTPVRNTAGALPSPAAPTSANLDMETDFRLAAREGDVPTLKALLGKGVNINARDEAGWTALREAVFQENIPAVKFLVDHHADPNVRDVKDGTTALSWAAQTGQTQVVKALLGAGADVNVHDTFSGMTPLGAAAGAGYVEIVRLLIAGGADVNAKDKFGDLLLPEIIDLHESALRSGRQRDAQALARTIRVLREAGARKN